MNCEVNIKIGDSIRNKKYNNIFIIIFLYPDWNGFKSNLEEQSSAATTGVICSVPM